MSGIYFDFDKQEILLTLCNGMGGLERRNRMLADHVQSKFYQVLFKPVSTKKALLRFIFLRNIVAFLILALANPLLGKMKQNTKADNLELVICLDISNSMNAKDIENTSRLEVAKRGLSQLVNQLKGERIGMCVFAGTAFVQLPLTNDYHAAKLFTQEIETDMISAQGTNISSALTNSLQFKRSGSMLKEAVVLPAPLNRLLCKASFAACSKVENFPLTANIELL